MASIAARLNWGWRLVVQGLLLAFLGLGLVACQGRGTAPPDAAIQQFVVRQFEQTQQELRQQLTLPPIEARSAVQATGIKISRLQQVTSGERPTYRVQGTYTLAGKSLSRSLRQTRNPFEIYLQSQDGGQTWTLQGPQAPPNA